MDGFILFSILIGIGILIYVAVGKERGMMASEDAAAQAASKLGVEIAEIREEVTITNWGTFSRFGLGLGILIETIALFGATSIFQQIQAGVAFIGTAIVCGLGVAMGRRRTYRVYRTASKTESDVAGLPPSS
ncbi:hypothetical protein V5279_23850 [Bradyrhizobium sp. 26S5]|uniref:hypothetical protein n=1 Tax=Bradyrhizobium sp. 26S5 TaxID=3139729 RepID=UPI0030CAF4DB